MPSVSINQGIYHARQFPGPHKPSDVPVQSRRWDHLDTHRNVRVLGATAWGQGTAFRDVTVSSGVDAVVDACYRARPKLWLSGIDLVDLDGDGKLDLFFAPLATGLPPRWETARAIPRKSMPAAGTIPPSTIDLAYDINEDGKLDLQMTFNYGGGKWRPTAPRLVISTSSPPVWTSAADRPVRTP